MKNLKISFKKVKDKVKQLQKYLKNDRPIDTKLNERPSLKWIRIEEVEIQLINKEKKRWEFSTRLLYQMRYEEDEIWESILALVLFSRDAEVINTEIKIDKNFDENYGGNTTLEITANFQIIQ